MYVNQCVFCVCPFFFLDSFLAFFFLDSFLAGVTVKKKSENSLLKFGWSVRSVWQPNLSSVWFCRTSTTELQPKPGSTKHSSSFRGSGVFTTSESPTSLSLSPASLIFANVMLHNPSGASASRASISGVGSVVKGFQVS